MKYELYEVGGRIRDEFLGLRSKDIDYSVVIEGRIWETQYNIDEVFVRFCDQIENEGFKIFKKDPDCFTVRAKFPKDHVYSGLDADFVLARKEVGYIKGTRQPNVVLGTLEDDLVRRDFTVNTLAKGIEGEIVDLFGGVKDLQSSILRTPGDSVVSFNNDPLRILRAMRFSVTKSFGFSDEIITAIRLFKPDLMDVVSKERIQDELTKMFKHDTMHTLTHLHWLKDKNPRLLDKLFDNDIWLMPTTKK